MSRHASIRRPCAGWLEIQAEGGADEYAWYDAESGAKRTTPPDGAPDWYRMDVGDGTASVYYWHGPSGGASWVEPAAPVWAEVCAPELPGRKVYAWAGD